MNKVLKILLALAVMGIMVSPAMASTSQGIVQQVFKDEPVVVAELVTSRGFKISSSGYFGLWRQATSATTWPTLTISYEMSYDDVDANYATPAGASAIATDATSESIIISTLSPTPMAWIRFKVQGALGNSSESTLTMYMFNQED